MIKITLTIIVISSRLVYQILTGKRIF